MPSQHTLSNDDLLSELESHNTYFDSIVNLIPAKLYVAGASGDDAYNVKYLKGQHKESREARKARNKMAKVNKFHPDKMESTLEVKRRMKQEEEEEEDDSENDEDIEMSDGDGQEEEEETEKNGGNSSSSNNNNKNGGYASRIEMLRAKLQAKMAEKRAAAGITADDASVDVDTSAPALVSKRAARRAEKRKRKEAAMARNKKKLSSVAETKQPTEQRVVNMGGSTYNAPTAKSSKKDTTSAADDLATIDYQSLAGLKPKLDGTLDNKSLGQKKKKSLESLLADAERKQARLRELKESGLQEDKQKAANIQWGEALKVAASGGATNTANNLRKTTDPKLLKKALKKKAKKKAASAKAWNVRLDQKKDAATKKQAIRVHNLDARLKGGSVGANLSSKRIKEDDNGGGGDGEGGGGGAKRSRRLGPHSEASRNRAGFEGKKSGFINGKDGGGKEKGKQ